MKISIDRKNSFDLKKFGRYRYSCVRIVEEDARSLSITEIDLNEVRISYVPTGARYLDTGKEHFMDIDYQRKALKNYGFAGLDAYVYEILLENQDLIPDHWKTATTWGSIIFTGTVLQDISVYGNSWPYVAALKWDGERWTGTQKYLHDSCGPMCAFL